MLKSEYKYDGFSDKTQTEAEQSPVSTSEACQKELEAEKILCPHCQRTATNGINCKGICVADSDY